MEQTIITNIVVRDVKGISEADIECRIFPNQPNFIVAPNGSGKSSLAIAFESLKRNGLRLDKYNWHRGTDGDRAYLEIKTSSGETFAACASRNDIARFADVQVIRSGLYAKASSKLVNGVTVTQGIIRVHDITLWNRVPEKASIGYSVAKMRQAFPEHVCKLIVNLHDLLGDEGFLRQLVKDAPASIKGRRNNKRVQSFLADLDSQLCSGTKQNDLVVHESGIRVVQPVMSMATLLSTHLPNLQEPALLLNAIQLCWLYGDQSAAIKTQLEFLTYKRERSETNGLISALNTTGKVLRLEKRRGKVILHLPDRSQLSNGELDVLNFAAQLVLARKKLSKHRSILIVDEVFDYLDDANLLVAQYYLLQMIEQFKREGKELYPILLTHMDPSLMSSYRFKVKHVSYFSKESSGTVKSYMQKVLADRSHCKKTNIQVYEDFSRKYLHYDPTSPEDSRTRDYLKSKGLPDDMVTSEGFRKRCLCELETYLQNGTYDITMVCCAVRHIIEQAAYKQLERVDDKEGFLNTHGTNGKLEFAEEHGAELPEMYFLLGGVYNPAMHLTGEEQQLRILGRKLDNKVIKNMIRQTASSS